MSQIQVLGLGGTRKGVAVWAVGEARAGGEDSPGQARAGTPLQGPEARHTKASSRMPTAPAAVLCLALTSSGVSPCPGGFSKRSQPTSQAEPLWHPGGCAEAHGSSVWAQEGLSSLVCR